MLRSFWYNLVYMNKVEYRSPAQNLEFEADTYHTFEICDPKGEIISRAEVEYFSKPIPYYQLTDISTEHDYRGEGFASLVMDAFEAFLKKRGKAGFLVDAIMDGDPAQGWYERRGWLQVAKEKEHIGQYVFNLPKDVLPSVFRKVEMRQTPLEERESFSEEEL